MTCRKNGVTHAALAPVNPRIVCAHLSGYGRIGPRAAWPAFDYLMQAEAGFMDLTGEAGAPRTRRGLSIVEYMTGITRCLGPDGCAVLRAEYGAGPGRGCHAV